VDPAMRSHPLLDAIPLSTPLACEIVSYPNPYSGHCHDRLEELRRAGVECLVSGGRTLLATRHGRVRVLGKGHSSVVIAALLGGRLVAAKLRRTDSKRGSLEGEYRLLREAWRVGAAPKPFHAARDIILMEIVPGPLLGEIARHGLPGEAVRRALLAARALDAAGILHRELSRAGKHVAYTSWSPLGQAVILDYESASQGKCGSVNRLASWLGNRGLIRWDDNIRIILREYKREGCTLSAFNEFMGSAVPL